MRYYIDANALNQGDGSSRRPFQRIQQAADIALPGDEVIVYPGIYREDVNPIHAGTQEQRIVYRSAEPGKAVITGAERISSWNHEKGHVWTARVPNRMFGSYNPYTTLVRGDWFDASRFAHTGEVYLNGKSMYETENVDSVYHPVCSQVSWEPEFSMYVWYTRQDPMTDETVFYANFQDMDPNKENVEISVRRHCFYPSKEGVGYITLSGFTVCKAATGWAPPTAYQEGMIGPHWSKGWVIEDCDVSESKCVGISLGKYLQPENENKWLNWKYKDGTQTERDCICQAQREGWTKERIGSHIIRRCHIHHCGQAGIVGHLGSVFSVIEDNHIHDINTKQNLTGAEIGGIKLHAAIDVTLRGNHIHHCTKGIWLDWQAQGTRVTGNLFHDNTLPYDHLMTEQSMDYIGEDVFVEVSHGPTLIDNNFLLSDRAMKICAQGVAVVHNLIAGAIAGVGTGVNNGAPTYPSPRYTPYHVTHGTEIAGFMTILHGDVRFYNNLFVQRTVRDYLQTFQREDVRWDDYNFVTGLNTYAGFQTLEEWKQDFEGYCGMGSPASDRYYKPLPVWTGGNVYFNGAIPWEKEKDCTQIKEHSVTIRVSCGEGEAELPILVERNGWKVQSDLYSSLLGTQCGLITTDILGMAFEPEQKFENPDGTPVRIDIDYAGTVRGDAPTAGPLEWRETN